MVGAAVLAVVQLVLALEIDFDEPVQTLDDLPLLFRRRLRFARVNGGAVDEVALSFDVQFAAVATQVGVANRRGQGNDASGADAVVAEEKGHLLQGVGAHLQVILEDGVLGGSRGALQQREH